MDEFKRPGFDGTQLLFRNWTDGQTPKGVVCLVHGLGEHSGRYMHWGEMFNAAGYALISYDLRGHGNSGGQRGHVNSFEEYYKDTDLLLQIASVRFPGRPMFIYGHSMGAIISVGYVLHRKPKVNGVVISALAVKNALQEQKSKMMLSRILGTIVPKMTIASGLVPDTISRDPDVVYRYTHDPLVHDKISFGFGKEAIEAVSYIQEHASEWVLPVLFMHGEKDALGYADGSREIAGKIKGDCTLKIWPGMYHEVHNEPEKEQVFEFVREWLDKHLI